MIASSFSFQLQLRTRRWRRQLDCAGSWQLEAELSDERHRSPPRLEDLSPLRSAAAVRDAQERAAVAEPGARSKPDETFAAVQDVSFTVPPGPDARRDRPQRLRQEHDAQAGRRHHQADDRQRQGAGPDLGADRARRRLPPGDLRARERLHQRHHARPDEEGDHPALRRDRRVRRARGVHRRAGEDLLVRHVHAARIRGGDSRRSRRAAGRRSARGRRRGLHPQVPRQVRRVQAPRPDDPAGHALARAGRAVLRRGDLARSRAPEGRRRSASHRRRLRHRRRGRGGDAARRGRRQGARIGGGDLAGRTGDRGASGSSDRDRRSAGRHVPRHGGPLGIPRGRDHRRDAAPPTMASAGTCSIRARRWRSGSGCARRWR